MAAQQLRAYQDRLKALASQLTLAEEKERQHREELAHVARLNTMGEMASSLAHEINQPLTAIVGYTRSCLRRLRSADWSADELVDPLEKAAAEQKVRRSVVGRLVV